MVFRVFQMDFNSLTLIDLLCKSLDWFLYDRDLRHERIKFFLEYSIQIIIYFRGVFGTLGNI